MRETLRKLMRLAPETTPRVETEDERPCPHCHLPISRGATVCLHCERETQPLMSYAEFALKFGSPHSGGPPHGVKGLEPEETGGD